MNKTLLLSLGLFAALPAHAQNPSHVVTAAATPEPARLAAAATDLPLTLEHAWQLAEQANPALKNAQANLVAVEGQLADTQGLLWNNPQITAERVRRTVPDPGLNERTQREWGMGVTQTLEIAGQQGYRRTAAEQELAALRETIEETRRQLRAEVEQKFIRVVALQLRAEMETGLVDLIKENSTVSRKRFDAGEDTKLDANLAEVELGRAQPARNCRRATDPGTRRVGYPAATAGRETSHRQGDATREAGAALHPGPIADSGSQSGAATCPRSP